jgi:hypothetical protein
MVVDGVMRNKFQIPSTKARGAEIPNSKHQSPRCGNSKFQAPNSKQFPNTKSKYPNNPNRAATFRILDFGFWICLEFGAWNLEFRFCYFL